MGTNSKSRQNGRCLLQASEIILAFLRTGDKSSGAIDEFCLSGGDRWDVKPFSVSQDSGCYKTPWGDEIREEIQSRYAAHTESTMYVRMYDVLHMHAGEHLDLQTSGVTLRG